MFVHKATREACFQLIFILPWLIFFHLTYTVVDFDTCQGSLAYWFKCTMIYYFYAAFSIFVFIPCRVSMLRQMFEGRFTLVPQILTLLNIVSNFIVSLVVFIGFWISYMGDKQCFQLHNLAQMHLYFHLVIYFFAVCFCSCVWVVDLNSFLRMFIPDNSWIRYYIA